MSRLERSPLWVLAICSLTAPWLLAADSGGIGRSTPHNTYIVVGFAGGFVRPDNQRHGPVRLAEKIRKGLPQGDSVFVFENRHRKAAYKTILRLLDKDRNGTLTEQEKANARIILFGHSWGASAVVLLSRELDRAGIPVLLTVQVDSVAKPWQRDKIIPDNVAEAANFYQPHGLVHGRSEIEAEDNAKTHILGNYRFDYKKEPVQCLGASWVQRVFTPSHMQSDCDPRLWLEVEDLVRQRMEPQSAVVAPPSFPSALLQDK